MGRRRKKSINKIAYLIAIVIITILSALGIELSAKNTDMPKTTPVNVANLENLQNITIKTGNSITKDFISNEKNNLKVYFFDVGQSDSILVINENQTMLIDAGNNDDGNLLVKNLKTIGVTKIDYLIGTHPHEDHIGGLDDIIKNFEIGNIYMPKVQTNTKTFEDVLDAVLEKDLTISTPKVNDEFLVGNAKCIVMAVDNNAKNLNLSSIVIKVQFEDISYLFMGDAEKETEEKILNSFNNETSKDKEEVQDKTKIKANILKVGHHGSDTSSSEKFIKAVAPDVSIISVGKDNSYNHPNSKVIQRLNKIGSKVYRTDEVGNILIEQYKNKVSKNEVN